MKKKWVLFFAPLLISACSNTENTRYKDLSHLEKPPEILAPEKVNSAVMQDKKSIAKKGLGQVVTLSGPADQPILKIKKIFDRSWSIVEQALNLAEIEVTDKNRDKGVFYLKFDPDKQLSKDSSLVDSMTFFLFKDEYDEGTYKLSVVWRDSDTEVSAELIDQKNDGLLDDEFEETLDFGSKLIERLYKTIRDDFPVE